MTTPLPVNAEFVEKVKEYADKVGGEIANQVHKAIEFVHMGLGDPGAVNAAQTAWGVTGVRAIATATQDVKTAVNNLSAYWEGPASTAFTGYVSDLTTNSGTTQTAFTGVQTALADVASNIVATYNLVIGLLGTCAQTIITFEEGVVGSISEDVAELVGGVASAIFSALNVFVSGYISAVQNALSIIAGYKQDAITAMSSIAALGTTAVQPLPAASADPSEYSVVHKPGS